jgi:3-oxoacyl-[acyl-carrier-protein] synthase III
MSVPPIALIGTGAYVPERVMTNDDLAKIVDTSDDWIFSRTGIKERRIAAEDEQTSDMAAAAARVALSDAGLRPDEIDLCIVATLTPDLQMPSTACLVQAKLGVPHHAACFDVSAACSGFVYALDTAWAMLQSGRYRHALVIGAEKISTVLDWTDRTTCVLFGDAAGAVVLGPSPAGSGAQIIGSKLYSEGENTELLWIPGGGSVHPVPGPGVPPRFMLMKGREVFKLAVREMEDAARDILEQCGIDADEVDCVIPHQANLRIIDSIAKFLQLPPERFFVNLQNYGNTSAASIPLAVDEARRSGRIKNGSLSLLVAFGAGLTYGSALVRW